MTSRAAAVALLVVLQGCAADRAVPGARADAGAVIADAGGNIVGSATVTRIDGGLRAVVVAERLPPGSYAVHLHTVGKCEGPAFSSAGGHWNPEHRQHGRDNPMGAHKGDLPNLAVGADGRGTVSFDIAGVTLDGAVDPLLDADGAAVMIHAAADDYRTDPTGNAGARQACGVLVRR